ncbi:hypothetical protein UFOVP1616_26 [uncultured Caudovirales phage]|uniref:Uncharacterized protein n=1 Tax=uncultured Caudovirales phage TaxID=2100421 RepID=A0A6J5SWB1_9CAUD|nr:hypothetical protein UFOVP1467_42 [uncultured Caudovirales phage]CAB4219645.1 hypothetical protein UFOVP1616_26 [uncultured Caudovirales phage]
MTYEEAIAAENDRYEFKLKHNRGSGPRETGIRINLRISHANAIARIKAEYGVTDES